MSRTNGERKTKFRKCCLRHQFANFFLLLKQLSGPSQKTCISQPQPSSSHCDIKTSHAVMLLPLHPTEKKGLKKISFWQPAHKQPLLSAASHQGFVRQARSEPRAFKTPIMQQDSAGQKEQECFRQSCGHTGIIHSSVALWIFCESYKQRGRPAKAARSFDNWELYKFQNPHRRI